MVLYGAVDPVGVEGTRGMRVLARTGRKAGVLSREGVSRFRRRSVVLPTAFKCRGITLEWMDWGEHACALKSPPWVMVERIP